MTFIASRSNHLCRGPYPLSFAQQRMWFLHQLDPESPLYNGPFTIRIKSVVRVDALRRAMTEIVARHEALRTIFPVDNGTPSQMIVETSSLSSVECPTIDWRELPLATRVRDGMRAIRKYA